MSQKLNSGGRERLSQVADLSFKNCNLGPKTAIFGPKQSWNPFKTAKERESVGTLHVRLDFPMSTSPLRPSNSTICPGNGPKRPPKAPNFVQIGWRQPQTKNRPYLWLHGSKCDSEGTYSTQKPPRFVVSTPHNCPNGHLDPRTQAQ